MSQIAHTIREWKTPIAILGEGPVWDSTNSSLYWTDIQSCKLYRLQPKTGAVCEWRLPQRLCSFALRTYGGFVGAFETGFGFFKLTDTTDLEVKIDWIEQPYRRGAGIRFNDGKTDPIGRFLSGSMHEGCTDSIGALWSLNAEGQVKKLFGGICVSNAIAWSPDGGTMYFTDSVLRLIWRYPYNLDTGQLGERQIHADVSHIKGVPDGAATDIDGTLWLAFYGGSCIAEVNALGKVMGVLPLPVSQPTCCAFGGPNNRILYVTSAAENLSAEELKIHPASGKIFSFKMHKSGIVPPRMTI